MDSSRNIKWSHFKNVKVNKALKQSNKEPSSIIALLTNLNKYIKRNYLNNVKVYKASKYSIKKSGFNIFLLANLIIDLDRILDNKPEHLKTLHVKWENKDSNKAIKGSKFIFWQKTRCNDIEFIIFSFALCLDQINII